MADQVPSSVTGRNKRHSLHILLSGWIIIPLRSDLGLCQKSVLLRMQIESVKSSCISASAVDKVNEIIALIKSGKAGGEASSIQSS